MAVPDRARVPSRTRAPAWVGIGLVVALLLTLTSCTGRLGAQPIASTGGPTTWSRQTQTPTSAAPVVPGTPWTTTPGPATAGTTATTSSTTSTGSATATVTTTVTTMRTAVTPSGGAATGGGGTAVEVDVPLVLAGLGLLAASGLLAGSAVRPAGRRQP